MSVLTLGAVQEQQLRHLQDDSYGEIASYPNSYGAEAIDLENLGCAAICLDRCDKVTSCDNQ